MHLGWIFAPRPKANSYLKWAKKAATESVLKGAETHIDSFQTRFPAEAYIG